MNSVNVEKRPSNVTYEDNISYQIILPTKDNNKSQIWYDTKKYDNPIDAYYENKY